MSLYREVGRSRRAIALAAAVALAIGLAAGFATGRGTAPEPSLAERVDELGESVQPALNALELVGIEYPQAVDARGEVIAETEIAAAEAQARSAAATLESARPELETLDPAAYDRAIGTVELLERRIEAREPPQRILAAADEAAAATRRAAGIAPG